MPAVKVPITYSTKGPQPILVRAEYLKICIYTITETLELINIYPACKQYSETVTSQPVVEISILNFYERKLSYKIIYKVFIYMRFNLAIVVLYPFIKFLI